MPRKSDDATLIENLQARIVDLEKALLDEASSEAEELTVALTALVTLEAQLDAVRVEILPLLAGPANARLQTILGGGDL